VTWTLEHPEQVYRAFRDLLKPDGMLLIYDANWHLHFFDEQARERVLAREQRHFETYGVREVVSGGDMAYYETAPLTRIRRPAWDRKTLEGLGFSVCITEDIGRWLYEQWEKDLYGESPLFEICAMKSASDAIRENMHTYWQQRAASFGFGEATVRRLMDQVRPCLPEGQLDVLDVGTGTGVVAAAMARLGHRVTAADLCGNMLEKAKENLTAMGLTARYVCAAAGKLPFAENSFDVIISRNVTWALPEPEQTLGLWQKLLRPGGRLIYWDGNHYYYLFNETDAENRQRLQAWLARYTGKTGTTTGAIPCRWTTACAIRPPWTFPCPAWTDPGSGTISGCRRWVLPFSPSRFTGRRPCWTRGQRRAFIRPFSWRPSTRSKKIRRKPGKKTKILQKFCKIFRFRIFNFR
jgi:2-polyprenyl-3-methyl-5-hydroxy-6-metoxy-1,4-benzoquinol methylase